MSAEVQLKDVKHVNLGTNALYPPLVIYGFTIRQFVKINLHIFSFLLNITGQQMFFTKIELQLLLTRKFI